MTRPFYGSLDFFFFVDPIEKKNCFASNRIVATKMRQNPRKALTSSSSSIECNKSTVWFFMCNFCVSVKLDNQSILRLLLPNSTIFNWCTNTSTIQRHTSTTSILNTLPNMFDASSTITKARNNIIKVTNNSIIWHTMLTIWMQPATHSNR